MASSTPATDPTSSSSTSTRKPYEGSCVCGLTRYITFLTLPPTNLDPKLPEDKNTTVRIRKCNCNTCHKMGLFHVRVPCPADDFILLSPKYDPKTGFAESGLKNFMRFPEKAPDVADWYFCGTCGVRCFATAGPLNGNEMVNLRELGVKKVNGKEVEEGETEVWKCKKEGWIEEKTGYLTINASTLEAGQEGLDLREWHEKGWISYIDSLDYEGENRLGRPHRGGMY